ncbi:hypothetical protein D9757_010121 [Collybiopsis confluens]|uniref:AB hydrolase-1 domain-containing protein n=1 Tax=Collybiopsis confluens TaxID=2823264 RepID=A0A8H5LV78_9AGAR|nr:hypothetical protein D9757_010121 [Collybiopsis confluens]
MQASDPLRLDAMAPELPPEILNHLPDLPSPPRNPLWHDDPSVPYTLSTHIIDAAPFRTCPELKSIQQESMVAHDEMIQKKLDPKGRQKMAKENVGKMYDWRIQLDESRRAKGGKLDFYERRLWNSLNRYVKKELHGSPRRKKKGLTLVFAHPIGCNKETWEPLILELLKTPAGRDIEEIWSWEAVDTGDSALLNEGRLNQLSDWYDSARDFIHFLLHYMPSTLNSDVLPIHLPRVSSAEFEGRIHRGYSDRRIIAIGHSFGGNVCARSCLTYPQLFSALVLADPGIVQRNHPTLKRTITFLAQFGFSRDNSWKSRLKTCKLSNSEEAFKSLQKSPFFAAWRPDAFKVYVETGLYSVPETGQVRLKMHPVYEALTNINAKETSEDMYEKLPMLDKNVYIKWVMPDPKKGGGIGGVPELSAKLVKERPGNTSSINLLGTAHMIPMEKPDEMEEPIVLVHRIHKNCLSSFLRLNPIQPKRKAAKRSFATTLDAREEEEDDTLIGPLERDLKRPRLLPPSNIQSDDDGDTLIPTPSPLKKSVQRHKISPYPKSTTTLKRHIPISAMEKACSYSGTFDLYAMDHQDLCEIYRPQHSTEPHYEDLYQTLTTRSGYVSEKLTAVVTLPDLPYGRKFGSVYAKAFCDPASERPYDVELTRISHVNQVYYREHERESFAMRYNTDVSMAGKVPGVSGETSVVAQDSTALESRGGFNISRMWYKLDGQGKAKEIFEGYLSLDVRYCKTIRKMGHGDGMNLGFAFWAVRR